jgi:hypothetical protein
MPNWIAEEQFDCVPRRGKRFTLVLKIGPPIVLPSKGKLSSFARAPLSMQPLFAEKNIGGENTFQALCLAIEHARTVFKVFLSEGGRIYWRDTENPIDVESPWFCPLPSMKELSRARKRRPPTS